MKPTIGRIVHFVLANGQHRAATVVNAWDTLGDQGRANLTVHLDQSNDVQTSQAGDGQYVAKFDLIPEGAGCRANGTLAVGSAEQDEDTKAPGTWHWPERE